MGYGVVVDFPHDIIKMREGSFRPKRYALRYRSRLAPNLPRSDDTRVILWTFDVDLAAMDYDRVIAFEGWLAAIEADDFAFRCYDPYRNGPSGAGGGYSESNDEILFTDTGGTPDSFCSDFRILEGSDFGRIESLFPAGSRAVICADLPVSTKICAKGDHVGIGENLYMVSSACYSDAEGRARIDFNNGLWRAALPGDLLNFRRPTARFVLAEKGTGTLVRDADNFGHAQLVAIEYPDQGLSF